MKVKELIELLQKMDQEKQVQIRNYEFDHFDEIAQVTEYSDDVVVYPN